MEAKAGKNTLKILPLKNLDKFSSVAVPMCSLLGALPKEQLWLKVFLFFPLDILAKKCFWMFFLNTAKEAAGVGFEKIPFIDPQIFLEAPKLGSIEHFRRPSISYVPN